MDVKDKSSASIPSSFLLNKAVIGSHLTESEKKVSDYGECFFYRLGC